MDPIVIVDMIRKGDIETFSNFLSKNLDIDMIIDRFSDMNLIHYIIYLKKINFFKILVEKGADIHMKNIFSFNAIHFACMSGHLEIVKYLIELGLDPHALTITGQTGFDIACENNYLEIVEYLAQFKL